VQIQEAENQIITHYDVFAERPSDRHLLVGAVQAQEEQLGRVPRMVAADGGYYSQANEQKVQQLGVQYVSVPNAAPVAQNADSCRSAAGSNKGSVGAPEAKGGSVS